jgi:hypothetical protein
MQGHSRSFVCLLLATCALTACKPATSPASDGDAVATPTSAAPAATPSTLSTIAGALNPLATPKDAIKVAMDKFLAVRSYHATMDFEGGPGGAMGHHEIDFVAPDRYRMVTPMGTQFIVGDTMYMNVHGRTMKVPIPKGTLSQWRDPAKLGSAEADMTVQSQGSDSVGGVPATKYLVHHEQPHPGDVTMWISHDDLPIQIQVNNLIKAKGKGMTSTTRYSRFDDPTITVDPPQ